MEPAERFGRLGRLIVCFHRCRRVPSSSCWQRGSADFFHWLRGLACCWCWFGGSADFYHRFRRLARCWCRLRGSADFYHRFRGLARCWCRLRGSPDFFRRFRAAHALGIEGARRLVNLDEVPLQAFVVVRAGIEDLPVAVRAPDLLRLLQGSRAAKQHAHGDHSDAQLVPFAHVPPPACEDDRRLLLVRRGRQRRRAPLRGQPRGRPDHPPVPNEESIQPIGLMLSPRGTRGIHQGDGAIEVASFLTGSLWMPTRVEERLRCPLSRNRVASLLPGWMPLLPPLSYDHALPHSSPSNVTREVSPWNQKGRTTSHVGQTVVWCANASPTRTHLW